MNEKINGFTLLELLVVIAILVVLTTFVIGNLNHYLEIGRDSRRKADLANIQRALEDYYEDFKAYPTPDTGNSPAFFPFGGKFCDNPNSCNKIYIQQVPQDPISTNRYLYTQSSTNNYVMFACIENPQDQGNGVKQSGYVSTDCGICQNDNLCKYGVSSANRVP